ncbi:hypothetical protein [Streptomyces sp. NPDC059874]|uniref:hypothetical protein n=1 Tax=Streptomyces sp. NPDC059874 TaxID=3346983 RepID=UPI0036651CBC
MSQANASGSAPTSGGLSLARQLGSSASYIWETGEGKVCFAQGVVSGGVHEIACVAAAQATPEEPGSRLDTFFGPGMGFSESYIVFVADPGAKVTSIKYEGKEVPWAFVRRLSSQGTGRDIYYAALPDGHTGWIDVTLQHSDGQTMPDRLPVTMGGGS